MNKLFGKLFALLIPLLLMLMITVVVSRYFFGVGRTDLQELALYVHGLIFLGCAGWAYLEDEHVRVDIIYRNASNNYKRKIDTLGIIFFLFPLIILIGYFSINFVSNSWMVQEASTEPGGLPFVYLQKTIILLLPIVLFFAAIEKLIKLWK